MIPLAYILLVVAHAWYDSKEIKKGVAVNHKKESIWYGAACFLLIWIFIWAKYHFRINTVWQIVPPVAFPLLTRAAFFDPILNKLIGKSWLYEGVKKPKDKESWFDRLERNIGLPTWVYRILYWTAYVTYLIIYLV